jgi:GDPmannose 4,6-dehydratase
MQNKKTALIVGITGQDGAYLAKSILSEDYIVVGTTRDTFISSRSNLLKLNIFDQIQFA